MTDVQRHFYGKTTLPSSGTSRLPLQSRNPNTIGALGSFNNSSTDEYNSKDMRLSNLESSNNENNRKLTTSASYGASIGRRSSATDVREAPAPASSSSKSRPEVAQRSSSLPNMDEDTVIIEEKRRRVNGDGYTVHRYLRGRLLGKGGFAKVYLCTALDTNKAYAIKIVPKANLVKARARQKLQAEIKIHRTLKHKYVCEYKHFFEDRENCYILLELCHNQSMNEMIKRRKRLLEPEAAYFGEQLLQAIQYLHSNLVIHRDLKLGNLFLDRHMNIKVGDLGLATKLESADEKRKTICGTPNYIAPEVIQGDRATRGHSFEVDVWSMGVILYTCMCGRPPYEAKDVKATYQRILANEYSFPPDVKISEMAKDLIRSMLQSKPADRPKLDEIAMHPFFTQQPIPQSLPSTATHVAPKFEENEFGELMVLSKAPRTQSSKPGLPRTNSARRPLSARDLNVERGASNDQSKNSAKQSRDVMEGAVKTALSALAQIGGSNVAKRSPTPTQLPSAKGTFRVFDETADGQSQASSRSVPPPPSTMHPEEDIVSRTAAMSIRTHDSATFTAPLAQASPYAPLPSPAGPIVMGSHQEQELFVLTSMIERVESVLEISSRRSYAHIHPDSPSLTAFSSGGPQRWVSRYVDYTSKYGLGFLLNDGSSGVYFNDSTKTVLEAGGDNFQYIERKKSSSDPKLRGEPVVEYHDLSRYPESLQKKVTLLKHFRNYLMEQQKKGDDTGVHITSSSRGSSSRQPMIYLKKWVRTKNAIFFRLSDHTVQTVFFDHTEILLTPDERHVTYVDKNRNRQTYYLTDELVGYNVELAKRLKYTKELLQQLVSGQKR